MKKLVASLAAIVFVGALTSTSTAGGSGKAIFEQYKCMKCHTIESQGIQRDGKAPEGGTKPPDLSDVGNRHKSDWIQKWLLKEEEQHGKKHIKKFSGSDDELKTLATWLGGLKKK